MLVLSSAGSATDASSSLGRPVLQITIQCYDSHLRTIAELALYFNTRVIYSKALIIGLVSNCIKMR